MTTSTFICISALFAGAGIARVFRGTGRAVALAAIPVSGVFLLLSQSHQSSAWWGADRLGVVLALMALIICFCAARFALRQFEGEERGGPILASSLAVVGGVVATDLARNLAALMISWAVTSLCTVVLLSAGTTWAKASAARQAAVVFGIADSFIILGVLLSSWLPGGISLTAPLTSKAQGVAAGVLLGVAAIAACGRAGLSLGRSWVTSTISVPTSTSALLHAGVVNAGALLLLRAEGTSGSSWVFGALLALVCVVVLLVLAPKIHARVDLKGQLAASTVSQMAFMLLAVALGWPLLAITHLVGHGLYKAGRFMSSGGATETRARVRRRADSGSQMSQFHRVAGVAALLVVAVALGVAVGQDALAAMSVVGPAAGVVWWQRTATPLRGPLVSWAVVAVGLATYGAMLKGAQTLLGASLPSAIWQAPWWSLGAVVALVTMISELRHRSSMKATATVGKLVTPAPALMHEVAA